MAVIYDKDNNLLKYIYEIEDEETIT